MAQITNEELFLSTMTFSLLPHHHVFPWDFHGKKKGAAFACYFSDWKNIFEWIIVLVGYS